MPDEFTPCVLVIQRDPNIIGKTKMEQVIHRWNTDVSEHVREDLIIEVADLPTPMGTARRMAELNEDYYAPGEPIWCDECFGEEIDE